MIEVQAEHGGSVVALMEVPPEQIHLYGCAAVDAVRVRGRRRAGHRPGREARPGRRAEQPRRSSAATSCDPAVFDVLRAAPSPAAAARSSSPTRCRSWPAPTRRRRRRARRGLPRPPLRHRRPARLPRAVVRLAASATTSAPTSGLAAGRSSPTRDARVEARREVTVDEPPRAGILGQPCAAAAAAIELALLDAPAACWPRTSSPGRPAAASTTPRWTATRCAPPTSPAPATTSPVVLPGGRRHRRPGVRQVPAAGAGQRRADHDRRAAARPAPTPSSRSSGPTAGTGPGRASTRRRAAGPARPPRSARTSRPASARAARRHAARPAADRPARRRRARPGAGARRARGSSCCPPAASWSSPGGRCGPARSTTPTAYALTAAVADAGAIAYRVGVVADDARHLRRRARGPARARRRWSSPPAGSAPAPTTSSRRCCRGLGHRRASTRWRCSRACRRASALAIAAGRRAGVPIFTLPGNPVSALGLLRGVRPPGAADDDGRDAALHRPLVRATAARGLDVAAPASGSSPAVARRAARSGGCTRDAGRRAGLAPGRRPGRGQRAWWWSPRRSPEVGRATRSRCLLLERGRAMSRLSEQRLGTAPRLTHLDDAGARPDGRRLRQGGHRPRGHRRAAGCCCSAAVVAALRGGDGAQGRRAGRRPDRRHPGRQAHAGPGAARAPGRRARRRGRPRGGRRRGGDRGDGAHRRPHRRRDGGADRGRRRRASPWSTWSRPWTGTPGSPTCAWWPRPEGGPVTGGAVRTRAAAVRGRCVVDRLEPGRGRRLRRPPRPGAASRPARAGLPRRRARRGRPTATRSATRCAQAVRRRLRRGADHRRHRADARPT